MISLSLLSTQAQVTIGMGEAPAKTALLQLKSQPADANNVTSKVGGFLPPRVELVKLNTLQPFMQPTDEGYDDEKKSSVGLFVYNVTTSAADSIYPGLYYWDGKQWDMLAIRTSGDDGGGTEVPSVEPPVIDIEDPAALKLSNCYIINPGRTVDIPVSKAYAVWKQKLNADIADLGTGLSVELVWQDRKDLITEVKLAEGDQGLNTEIRLTTNSLGYAGNAVIALKVGTYTAWSWHIWVNNYDPSDTSGQNVYNGYTFMDRNLGASFIDQGVVGSKGLLYQWGRKDPFPNSSTTTGTVEKEIYDIDNNVVTISKQDVYGIAEVDNKHLQTAIFNPSTFYFTSSSEGDWYTNAKANKNDNLWDDETNLKGPYDPCPPGWRVPNTDDPTQNSPWKGLAAQAYSTGTGITYPDAGYYPAAGYRSETSGDLTGVGNDGYVWSATTRVEEASSFLLFFQPYTLLPAQLAPRAKGGSVRCVKE